MNNFYIGPAGWSYPDWNGIVYSREVIRSRTQLEWIARCFNLVEINNTFYRIPSPAQVEKWIRRVEPYSPIRFNLKLNRLFTHEREESSDAISQFRQILNLVSEAGILGCLLVQFPWSFKCERNEKVYLHRLLGAFEDFHPAVEVRHLSWNIEVFFEYLQKHDVTFCNIDQPVIGQSLSLTDHVTSSRAYLRLHGQNHAAWFSADSNRDARYNYLYNDQEIGRLTEVARRLSEKANEVYIVTNNHYRGKAILNAIQLSRNLVDNYESQMELSPEQVR